MNPQAVLELLDQKHPSIIITPNARLQERLCAYVVKQAANQVCVQPDIYAWQGWCDHLWQKLQLWFLYKGQTLPLVLSDAQERQLWRDEIIKQQDQTAVMWQSQTKTQRLVELAVSANKRLQQWCLLTEQDQAIWSQEDNRAFLTWQHNVQQRLLKNNWLLNVERWSFLSQNLSQSSILTGNETIVFVGFDTHTPLQAKVIAQLSALGCCIYSALETTVNKIKPQLYSAENTEIELYAAADWAKKIVQRGGNETVGVVVPDLSSQRPLVERVFNEVFTPLKYLPGAGSHLYEFNISGGYRLIEKPLIQIIFDFLTLLGNKGASLEVWLRFLRSPFLQGAFEESSARFAVLHHMVERRQAQLSIQQVIALLTESVNLQQLLSQADQLMQNHRYKRYGPAEWAQIISDLLLIIGWPGCERVLTSEEYQTAAKLWPEVLDEFAALSGFCAPLSLIEVTVELKAMCFNKLVQTRSDLGCVFVLGLLEASGQNFDHFWVTGLQDRLWPMPVALHPLLPTQIQIDHDMPRSTPERESQVAERLFKRLLTQGRKTVVLSYPIAAQEVPLRPCVWLWPFIAAGEQHVTKHTIDQLRLCQHLLGQTLEVIEDQQGLVLEKGTRVAGGTQVIASQLNCPFQAFARFRLQAVAPEPVREGLLRQDQGVLLHLVLERLWQRIQTLERLQALNEDTRQQWVNEVVADVLTQYRIKLKEVTELQWLLEHQRLFAVVEQWLLLENGREASFVVLQTETQRELQLGDLSFQLRIDRVDQLEQGIVLWDYKSSHQTSVQHCFTEPMKAPQLPLYTLTTTGAELLGFGLAKLAVNKVQLEAVTTQESVNLKTAEPDQYRVITIDKITKKQGREQNWSQQRGQWSQLFESLAQQFAAGTAVVQPAENACQYCDLQALCRIQERQ